MDLRVVAFFLLVGFGMSQAERPRGVRPDMAGFYDAADEFHCLDGSNTIPFDMVNDDYCDCTVRVSLIRFSLIQSDKSLQCLGRLGRTWYLRLL